MMTIINLKKSVTLAKIKKLVGGTKINASTLQSNKGTIEWFHYNNTAILNSVSREIENKIRHKFELLNPPNFDITTVPTGTSGSMTVYVIFIFESSSFEDYFSDRPSFIKRILELQKLGKRFHLFKFNINHQKDYYIDFYFDPVTLKLTVPKLLLQVPPAGILYHFD